MTPLMAVLEIGSKVDIAQHQDLRQEYVAACRMWDGRVHKFRCLMVLLHFFSNTIITSKNMHAIVVFLFFTSWGCFHVNEGLGYPGV